MRPGQQNKRGRGRNNNNNNGGRKGGNPLSRTYDSSGPDVKIRGTAQHIAEKYAALARDAQGSGDNVMAENYLQHAEHYNRIIAAAQAQMQERYQRDERDGGDRDHNERDEHDDYERSASERTDGYRANGQERGNGHDYSEQRAEGRRSAASEEPDAPPPHVNGSGPQPVIEGTPAEVAMEEEASAGGVQSAHGGRRRAAAGRPRRQPRKSGQGGDAGNADASAEGGAPQPEPNGATDPSMAASASD